jgi:hypothetical protein
MQAVAAQFSGAAIASLEQLQASVKAGADQPQWGWLYTPQAYVAAMATQTPHTIGAALQCPTNTGAVQVNPCLLQIATPTNTCAGYAAATQQYQASYDPLSQIVTSATTQAQFQCGYPTAIIDYPALNTTTQLSNYPFNPSGGVWLWGVKPQPGVDPRVQPFNSLQYSEFGLLSL